MSFIYVDMHQNNCISQWDAHDGEVLSLQFSSDENMCYSLGTDEKVLLMVFHMGNKLVCLVNLMTACQCHF